jgi:hypothetical protein
VKRTEPYAAPTPKVLYIHDDLSDYVAKQQGEMSPAGQLMRELFALVTRDRERVVESQIAKLVGEGAYAPFALAIGIGRAGERVAQQLHARTGWFPKISRIDISRTVSSTTANEDIASSGGNWRVNGIPVFAMTL